MASVTVERTLMKSPPELWSLLQDPAVVGAWLRVVRGEALTLTPIPVGPDHRHIPGSGCC